MQIVNSSDIRYTDKVNRAKTFLGKSIVQRSEILKFQQETGVSMPAKFWSVARIGRGMFDLDANNTTKIAETAAVGLPAETPVASTVKKHQFSVESLIPKAKETYVEWGNFSIVRKLVASNKFFTLYVTGDSGSGKNEMISQACAELGRPLVRVSITQDTKEEHLLGSKTLVDGNIVYEDGPVKWAAENGAVLLLDETSCGSANELMCLQNVLEGEAFFVKSANVMVQPVPGFCIIATDNTKGRGSDSGRYIGTNILNDAFLERFEMTMEQGYPDAKIERKIIDKLMQKLSMTDSELAEKIVLWVHAIRKTYMEEGLEEHITTRRACHIVKTINKGLDVKTAINMCVNRFDETTKAAMISLWDKISVPKQNEQYEPTA